jgi:thiol:disulfide interchange protein DsbC
MTRDQVPSSADCAHPVDRNVALAERLGVTGTPTLVAADGRVLPGAASAEQISAWLSRSTTSAEGPTPSNPAGQATGKAP